MLHIELLILKMGYFFNVSNSLRFEHIIITVLLFAR